MMDVRGRYDEPTHRLGDLYKGRVFVIEHDGNVLLEPVYENRR
jgi:hypothetical protein